MRWPVSVKGVLFDDAGNTLLGLNDRDEYELIGGRLEAGEQPHDALVREFAEESGLSVSQGGIVDAYCFEPVAGQPVLIVAYACRLVGGRLRRSEEHRGLAWLPVPLTADIRIPDGYRRAIGLAASTGP